MKKIICVGILCALFLPTNSGVLSKNAIQYWQTEFHQILIQEVQRVIHSLAVESKLNAKEVVETCLEYDMDIVFVLTQGMLESQLGTKGRARRTNSVWNVGAFDNGVTKYTYKSQTESLAPYILLLKKDYLTDKKGNQKTTNDLMNNFVNHHGGRYATCPEYEKRLKTIQAKILKTSHISQYQNLIC